MDYEQYQALLQRAGLHGFAIEISTAQFQAARRADAWMRILTSLLVCTAGAGFLLAWKNLIKSSELQVPMKPIIIYEK